MKRLRRAFGALSALVCLPAAAFAGTATPSRPVPQLEAQIQGKLLELPAASMAQAATPASRAEIVRFGANLAPGLLRVPLEGEVQIDEWPVAPGERAPVVLTRFDAYAPDAKIWKVGRGGALTEVPRSKLAFFRGSAAGDPESRVFVAVDPATSTFSGFSSTAAGFQEIRPLREIEPQAPASEHFVGAAEPLIAGTGETAWSCDQSGAPLEFLENKAEASTTLPIYEEAITSLHSATIAVDTDNELINTKFGGSVTTATNYIASLFASMTVIYERDLLIRLVQGTTFLRTAADPYTSTGSTFDKLQEFGNYWNANNSGINRAAAAMLSGRGGAGAAGIAWLDVLCSKTSGYSYTQLYTSGTTLRTGEVMVVAHEIGHNFGSPHTHCYNPPLDNCYNTESGCYTGTKSCPTSTTINGVPNVTGTLMSYCHLGGIGCTTSNVFHPGSVALLQPKIQNKVNVCIFPVGTTPPPAAPTISTVSPTTGTTAGGTVVTITGTGFQSGATVTFGGTAASSVTFNSSTKLTATAPAHAAGSVSVVVTNPGGLNATKNPAYFYSPPPASSDFYTVTPCRVLDTRNATGTWGGPALGPSGQRSFPIAGRCGVPSNATSVVANVTVFQPTGAGSLSVFPGNAFDLGTSVVNFAAGKVVANNAMLRLATDGTGTIGIRNNASGTTNVILDVTGYYLTATP
jgi:hypothetical protein